MRDSFLGNLSVRPILTKEKHPATVVPKGFRVRILRQFLPFRQLGILSRFTGLSNHEDKTRLEIRGCVSNCVLKLKKQKGPSTLR